MVPVAKRIGKELLLQAAPELIEVATKRKSPKEALKSTVTKTIKKQVGGRNRSKKLSEKNNGGEKKKRDASFPENELHREIAPISFQGLKKISNLIPSEATHSSLD